MYFAFDNYFFKVQHEGIIVMGDINRHNCWCFFVINITSSFIMVYEDIILLFPSNIYFTPEYCLLSNNLFTRIFSAIFDLYFISR